VLANTAGNLVHVADVAGDIDSSLADTTDILKVVLDRARAIDDKLGGIRHSDGTVAIVKHIEIANGALGDVRHDTKSIVGGLQDVNKNLTAICNTPLLAALPPHQC